jgi:hypothetical protein
MTTLARNVVRSRVARDAGSFSGLPLVLALFGRDARVSVWRLDG